MERVLHFDLSGLDLGWRAGLLVLILLLALYMLFEFLRVRRLRRKKAGAEALPPALEPVLKALTDSAGEQATGDAEAGKSAGEEEVAWSEPPAHLAQDAFMRGVERELAQMRDELDALRGEFAALREGLRDEMAQLKASQAVSPLYSDAMQMAVSGHEAQVIAERCGISRAEAELVASLVKSREH